MPAGWSSIAMPIRSRRAAGCTSRAVVTPGCIRSSRKQEPNATPAIGTRPVRSATRRPRGNNQRAWATSRTRPEGRPGSAGAGRSLGTIAGPNRSRAPASAATRSGRRGCPPSSRHRDIDWYARDATAQERFEDMLDARGSSKRHPRRVSTLVGSGQTNSTLPSLPKSRRSARWLCSAAPRASSPLRRHCAGGGAERCCLYAR
jgi:hypothetical protein